MRAAGSQFVPVTAHALSGHACPNEGPAINGAFLQNPIQHLERFSKMFSFSVGDQTKFLLIVFPPFYT
jgi:hypothetical protein